MGLLATPQVFAQEEAEDGAIVKVEGPDGAGEVPADVILVTVGRRPNTEGLEATGVNIGPNGQIDIKANSEGVVDVPGLTIGKHGDLDSSSRY